MQALLVNAKISVDRMLYVSTILQLATMCQVAIEISPIVDNIVQQRHVIFLHAGQFMFCVTCHEEKRLRRDSECGQ